MRTWPQLAGVPVCSDDPITFALPFETSRGVRVGRERHRKPLLCQRVTILVAAEAHIADCDAGVPGTERSAAEGLIQRS